MKLAPFVLAALIGAGCGSSGPASHSVRYDDVVADVDAKGSGKLSVAVHDQRERIRKGEQENWAGRTRTAAGIPIDVYTASGKPLAHAMADSIAKSLRAKGFECNVLTVAPSDSPAKVKERIKVAGNKAVLLTLRVWETYTFVKTELRVDANLEVVGPDGAILGNTSMRETPILSDDPLDLDKITPPAVKTRLERLLNDPSVIKALGK